MLISYVCPHCGFKFSTGRMRYSFCGELCPKCGAVILDGIDQNIQAPYSSQNVWFADDYYRWV